MINWINTFNYCKDFAEFFFIQFEKLNPQSMIPRVVHILFSSRIYKMQNVAFFILEE